MPVQAGAGYEFDQAALLFSGVDPNTNFFPYFN